ncbi:hypothetical protein B0H19DRAFT_7287 [Mycena capillaripes]|nr:hypothetical protein B0H19DRAFT_7287 [Mycena capillaripes]
MSASATKNRFTTMEAFTDALLSLPAAQNNLLKYDLIIPNDKLDSQNKAVGFLDPEPTVLVKIECETQELFTQFLRDADVMQSIKGAAEFKGASMFATDVVTRIDLRVEGAAASTTWVGIFRLPPNLSTREFYQKTEEISDKFVALPVSHGSVVKRTAWIQNNMIAKDIQLLGIPPSAPVVVLWFQAVSQYQYFSDLLLSTFFL